MRADCVAVVFAILGLASGANILALLGVPSPSHHIWNRCLVRALAARGHVITVLSVDEETEPLANFSQYVVEGAYDDAYDFVGLASHDLFTSIVRFFAWGTEVCEANLLSEGASKLTQLAESAQFDLVIVDVSAMDCMLGFVHVFKHPPVVGITAYSHPLWASYVTGNPHNPAHVPEFSSGYTDHMTFAQRLFNTVVRLYTWWAYEFKYQPETDRILRRRFGSSVPGIRDLLRDVSLVLVNTHTSFDHARPLLPSMVEVGGLHIAPPRPLPQHLKATMDSCTSGFIFFSLGSNLRSDRLPADRRQVFIEAFSKLPHKVFWKWESDSLPDQPSNVILGKWMPQRDILAHPNIVLFISHCGLLSTQEALYSGVPILCIPFFADQDINANKAVFHGFGERVSFASVTADELLSTVQKIISNTRYHENSERLSRVFQDQPETPLERAVFWTEYVIRHKGAPHLHSAGADLSWYQYLLLDVVCLLVVGVATALVLVYKVCCIVVRLPTRAAEDTS